MKAYKEKLIRTICFCLLPNHFRLFVKQLLLNTQKEGANKKNLRRTFKGYNYFLRNLNLEGFLI